MARSLVLEVRLRHILVAVLVSGLLAGLACKTAGAETRVSSPYVPGVPDTAREYYEIHYGIDLMSVKLAESGALVQFRYRVTDADKARALHDRAAEPMLLDEAAGVILQVPSMEKVGPLRQSVAPEVGKSYWMVFSNKGSYVKAGHRVSVLIGQVRVDGLVVQ